MRKLFFLLVSLCLLLVASPALAQSCPSGQSCWGARTVSENICSTGGACSDPNCGACTNIPGQSCIPGGSANQCINPHNGTTGGCAQVCCATNVGGSGTCSNSSTNISCSETANSCDGDGVISQCSIRNGACAEDFTSASGYGCCGPGGGGGGGGGGGSTHAECQSQSCVTVSGGGANECSVDADCAPPPAVTHLECQSNACVVVAGAGADQCATDPDCVTTYSVSGSVYLDNSGTCSDTSTPILPGAGSVVTSSGLPDAAVGGGGAYSMGGVLGGTRVFTLSATDPQYVCSCPSGCSESVNVTGNTTINYFVTNVQGDWWQTRGGDVGANNGSISSNIPSTCVGTCKPHLSLYDGSPSDWPRSERSRVGF